MRNPRRPSEAARAALRDRLEGRSLPFAEAVLLQVAGPPGAAIDPAGELADAARIAGILTHAGDSGSAAHDAAHTGGAGDSTTSAASDYSGSPPRLLAADPVLLAAFFQNVDLLYAEGDPVADRVGGWIMEALSLAADRDEA